MISSGQKVGTFHDPRVIMSVAFPFAASKPDTSLNTLVIPHILAKMFCPGKSAPPLLHFSPEPCASIFSTDIHSHLN